MHESKNVRIFHQVFQGIGESGDHREDIKSPDHQEHRCGLGQIKKDLRDIRTLEGQETDIQE